MAKQDRYIGVFDSGVGGISVLRQLRKALPNERYLYFGDSANAPYGTRPAEEIRALTLAAVEKLAKQDIKALVIGCNTATSAALEAVQQTYPDLIVVGIEPALAVAARQFPGGHVGVMATPATLKGNRFQAKKSQYDSLCTITPLPAPGLMELVEAGKADSPEADALLHALLDPYASVLDGLVLGCTHYPFTENSIRRVLGENIPLFDGAVITAQGTKEALAARDLLREGPGEVHFQNSLPGETMLTLSRQLAGLQ